MDGLRRPLSRGLASLAAVAIVIAACGPSGGSAATGASAAPASISAGPSAPATNAGDGVLNLGYLLAETGPLANLGPPQISAFKLAVNDVNDAGGVLGKPITIEEADEAGDPAIASQSVDRLLGAKVDGVIGAISSAISLAVIDKLSGAGVVECSGSNTSRTFTDYADDGYYFRAVPSNLLQASVFAETIVDDGAARVALLVRSDDYGESLGDAIEKALTEQGATVVSKINYDPKASNFDVEVGQVADVSPDAVVVVAFDEGAAILQALLKRGLGPSETKVYGSDGMAYATLQSRVDPNDLTVLDGMKGIATSSANDPAFLDRLIQFNPELKLTNFAPYVYDCVATIALAATAAGTDDPKVFKDQIIAVTRDGTKCEAIKECLDLLAAGTDIDYDGVSGPLDYAPEGEPTIGLYDVIQFDAQGKANVLATVRSGP